MKEFDEKTPINWKQYDTEHVENFVSFELAEDNGRISRCLQLNWLFKS